MSDARRAGSVALIILLAGGVLLHASHLGSVRVAGVGLLWWYAGLLAPVLAASIAMLVLATDARAPRLGMMAMAMWLGPVFVTTLTARAFAGAGAPTVALAVCCAPLLGLLASAPAREDEDDPVAAMLTCVAVGIVLSAQFAALVDVGRVFGLPRWLTVLVVVALTLTGTLRRSLSARPRSALIAGTATLVGMLLLVGVMLGIPPWAAWRMQAARPALAFADGASPVTSGITVLIPTTLVFSEPHRVTALIPGVFRVVERDTVQPVVREWQLGAGESLALRPGDELGAGPGARLRFEAGRRVPGVAPSGAAWADVTEAGVETLLATIGLTMLLAGGAVGLAPRPSLHVGRREALMAPLLAVVGPVALLSWGVYAAWTGVDLMLAAPSAAAFIRLPLVAVPAPWNIALTAAVVLATAALFGAATAALRGRFEELATPWIGTPRSGPGRARYAWATLVLAAAVAAAGPVHAWSLVGWGAGLAATVWAASVVDEVLGPRLTGTIAGAGAFLALGVGGMAAERCALVAVPLAWVSAQVAARARD